MQMGNREAKLDARPILGRTLLLAVLGLVAGIMLAMSASPALAQEGQESQQALPGPEQALFTGVLRSEENRFVFSKFFLVDEQNGGLYTLKSSIPPNEGGIELSEFVGERVSVQVIPMASDTPTSSERFNSTPAFVTRLEVLSQGEKFGEVAPAGEPCDAESLTSSQYDECTATKEEITSGGSGGGQGTPTVASTQGIATLPDTGGLELPVLVGGLALVLGGLVLRKRVR